MLLRMLVEFLVAVQCITATEYESSEAHGTLYHKIEQLTREYSEVRAEVRQMTELIKQQEKKMDYLMQMISNDIRNSSASHFSAEPSGSNLNATFNSRSVAFHACLGSDRYIGIDSQMNYDVVFTNDGGYYDPSTGTFTCPTTGMYLFSLNARSTFESATCELGVFFGSWNKLKVCNNYWEGFQSSAGNVMVTQCVSGEQVTVKAMYYDASCVAGVDNAFSGVLLYLMT